MLFSFPRAPWHSVTSFVPCPCPFRPLPGLQLFLLLKGGRRRQAGEAACPLPFVKVDSLWDSKAHTRPLRHLQREQSAVKTGNFSINKRSWGTGRVLRGFHNLTLFKSTDNSKGRGVGGPGEGRATPCPALSTEGTLQSWGSRGWGGSPLGVTSHMLGTGMRVTLTFQRKGSLYLAVGGDKAEATRAITSPQCLGESGGPPKFAQGRGPEQSISHG